MPPSRDVRSLYEIADKHHSRRRPKETLHAKALLKLIKKEALAFTEPDSSKLRELVDSFHHCQSVARLYPGSEQQKDSILQFLNIVDECFFFKALTRRVDTKKNGRQPLMALTVKDGYHNNRDSETIRVKAAPIDSPSSQFCILVCMKLFTPSSSSLKMRITRSGRSG
ncbi:hypothetical protein GGR51DRAFT_237570 [Nemania sp. FL0031]|nr:hypothetical protein GGR51DRAFT_237570 [Nemania sp. FL0031]